MVSIKEGRKIRCDLGELKRPVKEMANEAG